MNWSIPDVLRINDFVIEVKLTVQQFSDQEKNRLRWWDDYDLPRFKEVLMKEAAARLEGLPLETALLRPIMRSLSFQNKYLPPNLYNPPSRTSFSGRRNRIEYQMFNASVVRMALV